MSIVACVFVAALSKLSHLIAYVGTADPEGPGGPIWHLQFLTLLELKDGSKCGMAASNEPRGGGINDH